jgi:hypothetical protein
VALEGALAYGGLRYLVHLWQSWKAHRIGIYGIWGTGKTTLNRYLDTSGELEDDSSMTSTAHPYDERKKQYITPPPTRKRVHVLDESSRAYRRTIQSTDIGGHLEYFNLWLRDMVSREVEVVIYLIDDRHLKDGDEGHQQRTFADFAKVVSSKSYGFTERRLRKRARTYVPMVVALVANKADLWLEGDDMGVKMLAEGKIAQHEIFDDFRPALLMLQKAGIPTIKRSISALRGWEVERLVWDCLKAKS